MWKVLTHSEDSTKTLFTKYIMQVFKYDFKNAYGKTKSFTEFLFTWKRQISLVEITQGLIRQKIFKDIIKVSLCVIYFYFLL